MKIGVVLGLVGLAPTMLPAADALYVGKWKLNLAKSDLTGETLSIEKTGSGMRFVKGVVSYTFSLDGREYPMPNGGFAEWKALDSKNWKVTNRMNGRVSARYKLSLKGDTMNALATIQRVDGGTVVQKSTLTRISGGPGFIGKWESTEVEPAETTLELVANGAYEITLTRPEGDFTCSANFDGKDFAPTGRLAGSKTTFVFKKTGPLSFEMLEKTNGKATYVDTFTVSADGKTLTDYGTSIGVKEPIKAVYDRQEAMSSNRP